MTSVLLMVMGLYVCLEDSLRLRIPDFLITGVLILIVFFSIVGIQPPSAASRLTGMAAAWGQIHLSRIFSGGKMGLGDVKYGIVLAGLTGIHSWILAVVISSVLALVFILILSVKDGSLYREKIPFGPFLSLGAVTGWVWLWGLM